MTQDPCEKCEEMLQAYLDRELEPASERMPEGLRAKLSELRQLPGA